MKIICKLLMLSFMLCFCNLVTAKNLNTMLTVYNLTDNVGQLNLFTPGMSPNEVYLSDFIGQHDGKIQVATKLGSARVVSFKPRDEDKKHFPRAICAHNGAGVYINPELDKGDNTVITINSINGREADCTCSGSACTPVNLHLKLINNTSRDTIIFFGSQVPPLVSGNGTLELNEPVWYKLATGAALGATLPPYSGGSNCFAGGNRLYLNPAKYTGDDIVVTFYGFNIGAECQCVGSACDINMS